MSSSLYRHDACKRIAPQHVLVGQVLHTKDAQCEHQQQHHKLHMHIDTEEGQAQPAEAQESSAPSAKPVSGLYLHQHMQSCLMPTSFKAVSSPSFFGLSASYKEASSTTVVEVYGEDCAPVNTSKKRVRRRNRAKKKVGEKKGDGQQQTGRKAEDVIMVAGKTLQSEQMTVGACVSASATAAAPMADTAADTCRHAGDGTDVGADVDTKTSTNTNVSVSDDGENTTNATVDDDAPRYTTEEKKDALHAVAAMEIDGDNGDVLQVGKKEPVPANAAVNSAISCIDDTLETSSSANEGSADAIGACMPVSVASSSSVESAAIIVNAVEAVSSLDASVVTASVGAASGIIAAAVTGACVDDEAAVSMREERRHEEEKEEKKDMSEEKEKRKDEEEEKTNETEVEEREEETESGGEGNTHASVARVHTTAREADASAVDVNITIATVVHGLAEESSASSVSVSAGAVMPTTTLAVASSGNLPATSGVAVAVKRSAAEKVLSSPSASSTAAVRAITVAAFSPFGRNFSRQLSKYSTFSSTGDGSRQPFYVLPKRRRIKAIPPSPALTYRKDSKTTADNPPPGTFATTSDHHASYDWSLSGSSSLLPLSSLASLSYIDRKRIVREMLSTSENTAYVSLVAKSEGGEKRKENGVVVDADAGADAGSSTAMDIEVPAHVATNGSHTTIMSSGFRSSDVSVSFEENRLQRELQQKQAKKVIKTDTRMCGFCYHIGDRPSNLGGRLLPLDALKEQCEWVHVNCAYWSRSVYEEKGTDGVLMGVMSELKRGREKVRQKKRKSSSSASSPTSASPLALSSPSLGASSPLSPYSPSPSSPSMPTQARVHFPGEEDPRHAMKQVCYLCHDPRGGATVTCIIKSCKNSFHFGCGYAGGCGYADDCTTYCHLHTSSAKSRGAVLLTRKEDFDVLRRVVIEKPNQPLLGFWTGNEEDDAAAMAKMPGRKKNSKSVKKVVKKNDRSRSRKNRRDRKQRSTASLSGSASAAASALSLVATSTSAACSEAVAMPSPSPSPLSSPLSSPTLPSQPTSPSSMQSLLQLQPLSQSAEPMALSAGGDDVASDNSNGNGTESGSDRNNKSNKRMKLGTVTESSSMSIPSPLNMGALSPLSQPMLFSQSSTLSSSSLSPQSSQALSVSSPQSPLTLPSLLSPPRSVAGATRADRGPLAPSDVFYKVGALSVYRLGYIEWKQPTFHTPRHLFPIGYKSSRIFWSYKLDSERGPSVESKASSSSKSTLGAASSVSLINNYSDSNKRVVYVCEILAERRVVRSKKTDNEKAAQSTAASAALKYAQSLRNDVRSLWYRPKVTLPAWGKGMSPTGVTLEDTIDRLVKESETKAKKKNVSSTAGLGTSTGAGTGSDSGSSADDAEVTYELVRPIFKITAMNDKENPIIASSAARAWRQLLARCKAVGNGVSPVAGGSDLQKKKNRKKKKSRSNKRTNSLGSRPASSVSSENAEGTSNDMVVDLGLGLDGGYDSSAESITGEEADSEDTDTYMYGLSGAHFFGFGHPVVHGMLERLPYAQYCLSYQFKVLTSVPPTVLRAYGMQKRGLLSYSPEWRIKLRLLSNFYNFSDGGDERLEEQLRVTGERGEVWMSRMLNETSKRVNNSGCIRTESFRDWSRKMEMAEKERKRTGEKGTKLKPSKVVSSTNNTSIDIDISTTDYSEQPSSGRGGRSGRSSGRSTSGINTNTLNLSLRELPLSTQYRIMTANASTRVGHSRIHAWGLFASRDIEPHTMVIEYIGEVIRQKVADVREKRYEASGEGSCYMFRIDSNQIVDSTIRGNISRFINHSCDPNCYTRVIDVNGESKIIVLSNRFIPNGEEVTYNYFFSSEEARIACNCGSFNCAGRLN